MAPLYTDVRAYCSRVKMYCKRVLSSTTLYSLIHEKFEVCPRPDVFRKMLLIARNALFTSEPTLDLAISLTTTFFSCKDRAIRNLKFGDKTTIMFLLKVFIDKNIHIDDYTVSNKNVIRVSNSPSSKLRLPSFSVRRLTVNCGISELARSTWPQTHRPRGIMRPSD